MIFDVRLGRRELDAITAFAAAVNRLAAAHEKLAAQDDPDVQAALDAAAARLKAQTDQLDTKVQGQQSQPAP